MLQKTSAKSAHLVLFNQLKKFTSKEEKTNRYKEVSNKQQNKHVAKANYAVWQLSDYPPTPHLIVTKECQHSSPVLPAKHAHKFYHVVTSLFIFTYFERPKRL